MRPETTPQASSDLLYQVREIARYLNISTTKAAQHRIDTGEIPTFKIGGTICARRSTLDAWLAAKEAGLDPAANLSTLTQEQRDKLRAILDGLDAGEGA